MATHDVTIEVPADCGIDGVEAGASVTIQVDGGEYVLAAARAQGIWLPADCQQGWCTTCAGELLSGEVDQSDAVRYYDVDREADLVLLCVAKPLSDCRVRACRQEAMEDHRAEHDLPPGRYG